MPAIRPNRRSKGVATEDAIVSGLAPGKPPVTEIVGKSTRGSGETGRRKYAAIPAIRMAAASSEVAIGRRMKGAEKFIVRAPTQASGPASSGPLVGRGRLSVGTGSR